MQGRYPQKKLTIIGGGIVGAMQALYAWQDIINFGEQIRITIHEKNDDISTTTTAHIVPSLTPDEILSVVPRGQQLVNKLNLRFNEPGGIRVDDAPGVNSSLAAETFKQQVQDYSNDQAGHEARTTALLQLGKMSMNRWQELYDNGDPAFRKIMEESNFNPCREPRQANKTLHDGYRIDLIYKVSNAADKANGMKADYESLGYANCNILTPDEVISLDPFLTDFCASHSEVNATGTREWKNDSVALWRPGGCIDTQIFLPKLYAYLKQVMGQYTDDDGKLKDCFQIRFGHDVREVHYNNSRQHKKIDGLRFFGDFEVKYNKHDYQRSLYALCPGESVGTLKKLGFSEPAYAGFAGASLMLNIPIPADKIQQYASFNHCMEVHQEGVVLAWQARFRDNKIFIGVAGTKAFYSDVKPHKDQDFARDRNLLQLNMINDVLPEFISLALSRDTKGQKLGVEDLQQLENSKIAERWVGTRAVTYDGFPTIGNLYRNGFEIENGFVATHLGSGGVSFSPAAVSACQSTMLKNPFCEETIQTVLSYSDSRRRP